MHQMPIQIAMSVAAIWGHLAAGTQGGSKEGDVLTEALIALGAALLGAVIGACAGYRGSLAIERSKQRNRTLATIAALQGELADNAVVLQRLEQGAVLGIVKEDLGALSDSVWVRAEMDIAFLIPVMALIKLQQVYKEVRHMRAEGVAGRTLPGVSVHLVRLCRELMDEVVADLLRLPGAAPLRSEGSRIGRFYRERAEAVRGASQSQTAEKK